MRQAHLHLPVILTSAALNTLPADELGRLETRATLAKPFTAGELISAVHLATHPPVSTRIQKSVCRPVSGGFRLGCKPRRHSGINE